MNLRTNLATVIFVVISTSSTLTAARIRGGRNNNLNRELQDGVGTVINLTKSNLNSVKEKTQKSIRGSDSQGQGQTQEGVINQIPDPFGRTSTGRTSTSKIGTRLTITTTKSTKQTGLTGGTGGTQKSTKGTLDSFDGAPEFVPEDPGYTNLTYSNEFGTDCIEPFTEGCGDGDYMINANEHVDENDGI